MFTIEKARALLNAADVFYDDERDPTLNMNDTFWWGTGFGVEIKDEDLPRLAELFFNYGFHGLVWWVAKEEGIERSEFENVTRGMQFVGHEEAIQQDIPDSNDRAYTKVEYCIGGDS